MGKKQKQKKYKRWVLPLSHGIDEVKGTGKPFIEAHGFTWVPSRPFMTWDGAVVGQVVDPPCACCTPTAEEYAADALTDPYPDLA